MYFDLHQQRQVKAEHVLHYLQSIYLFLSYTAAVRSLQTLILDFNFFQLFFFQGGVVIQYMSLIT